MYPVSLHLHLRRRQSKRYFLTTALSNINLVKTSSNIAEVRAIIKNSSAIGETPTETFKMTA